MNKKTKNNKKYIIIIFLILFSVSGITIFLVNLQKNESNSNINIEGLDLFIDSKINDTDFIQLVSFKFERNEKIEYCIKKLMKTNNSSTVSVEKVVNYYIEIFGEDKDNPIIDYIRIGNLNNYELVEDEYVIKEENSLKSEMNYNGKVKINSQKVDNGQIIVKFKFLVPKPKMEYYSYFVNKKDLDNDYESYHKIINKLDDISSRCDNTSELTKEDMDYLLELAEEDIDKLAYVSEFEVVFEKLEDRFIIKDVKLI